MSYRPPAHGVATCRACGADLVDGASFCAECGTPQRVVHRGAAAPQRQRPAWLPFAIVAGGIAAVTAGALVGIILVGGPDEVAADPSASPSASAPGSVVPASSSATPSQSGTPTPTPEPTPEPAAVIPNRAIAVVTTDVLNVRASASESASILGELTRGRRLFVIGDPTEANDLRWYRLGVVASPSCETNCDLLGFVATPLAAEEAWIEELAIDCPSSPLTEATIAGLQPLEALHCFGRNEIVLTGTVETPCCGYVGPHVFSPEWLAHPTTPAFLRSAGIGFRPHPDAELEVPARGDVVRITGHYEDPAATSCRVSVDPSWDTGDETVQLPNPARVILDCRATFVWTDYEVTGHEDLGPCCGALPEAPAALAPISTRARFLG